MAKPKVINHFGWALRATSADGHKPQFTPHELLEAFENYSGYINNNPIMEPVLHQKSGGTVDIPRTRAMTIRGFCLYAGMSANGFYNYEKVEDYKYICEAIRDAIYTHKFEHAAAGLLNAQLISRDLGLNDSVQVNINDERKTIDDLFPEVNQIEDAVIVDTKELPYSND